MRTEFEKSSPPRDFYITTADVKNIRDALNSTSWRRAGNEATQVMQLVQAMGGAVFLYQPQETVGEGAARKVRSKPRHSEPIFQGNNRGMDDSLDAYFQAFLSP